MTHSEMDYLNLYCSKDIKKVLEANGKPIRGSKSNKKELLDIIHGKKGNMPPKPRRLFPKRTERVIDSSDEQTELEQIRGPPHRTRYSLRSSPQTPYVPQYVPSIPSPIGSIVNPPSPGITDTTPIGRYYQHIQNDTPIGYTYASESDSEEEKRVMDPNVSPINYDTDKDIEE